GGEEVNVVRDAAGNRENPTFGAEDTAEVSVEVGAGFRGEGWDAIPRAEDELVEDADVRLGHRIHSVYCRPSRARLVLLRLARGLGRPGIHYRPARAGLNDRVRSPARVSRGRSVSWPSRGE